MEVRSDGGKEVRKEARSERDELARRIGRKEKRREGGEGGRR